ncbi:hypothetical protein [Methanoculleus sp. 7T]|uniref:hypothetical protein n=1 Tax=Methanoculleus sp. 7T TaxID=2937282 RepID=UPI0020C0CF5D|nr:hypothetical protein [Methanoculleus sp. 7T]MCK8517369.1 hypothetical protein [Methanoculleus sp. 7T]
MELREQFTDDEWKNLVSLPYAISMAVIVAAPSVLGAWGEMKAMIQEPARLAAESGSALVGLVSAEMQSKGKELMKEQQDLMKRDQTGYRNMTIKAAESASSALSRVSPDEAMAYKLWSLAIGRRVAEAAKEHGVAISEPEKAVLGEISDAFGISAEIAA